MISCSEEIADCPLMPISFLQLYKISIHHIVAILSELRDALHNKKKFFTQKNKVNYLFI